MAQKGMEWATDQH